VGVPYDGDFWDFFEKRSEPKRVLPIATVITLTATGTEGSNSCVITHVENNLSKWSIRSDLIRPVFSIMNPELMFTLLPYQTACGITDMIAHIMERYLTNTEGVELTDNLCLAVMKTIVRQGAIAMQNPCDYHARANLMWAGTVAHNNSLGMDREQDWSSHKLEHELSALYGVAHGAGLAVILPAFMEYQLDHNPKRMARFASEIFDVELSEDVTATAKEGISRLRAYLKSIGMPLTLRDIAVPEEDIPLLASRIQMNNGDLFGFYRPLNLQQIEEVYRLAY
jgi:alcohol dehydrogenase YqhD (iron-dependent ADH family)